MGTSEHLYGDDPTTGHLDVRTRLSETNYHFLRNGHVLTAVRHCRSGEGTGVRIPRPMTDLRIEASC